MKEYGGYLEYERYYGKEYHDSGVMKFNSARNAILFIIRVRNYKKVYIPDYLCDCISNTLENEGIEYSQYTINEDYSFKYSSKFGLNDDECIFIVNYFGMYSNEEILNFKKKFKNIIIDNTQSFFQYPVAGIDTVYSCRKYFGVPDGAYCYCDIGKEAYLNLDNDCSYDRFRHLLGRFSIDANSFYDSFLENEEKINGLNINKMSSMTSNILRSLDYYMLSEKRRRNFEVLNCELKKINRLEVCNFAGNFMFPLRVDNAQSLRNLLIENKIYTPILWSCLLADEFKDSIAFILARDTIFLPVDQRYSEDDMLDLSSLVLSLYDRIGKYD